MILTIFLRSAMGECSRGLFWRHMASKGKGRSKAQSIIIHPGSWNLRLEHCTLCLTSRIGFSTDTDPYSVPHCIARRLRVWTDEHEVIENQLRDYNREPRTEVAVTTLRLYAKTPEHNRNWSFSQKVGVRVGANDTKARKEACFRWKQFNKAATHAYWQCGKPHPNVVQISRRRWLSRWWRCKPPFFPVSQQLGDEIDAFRSLHGPLPF